MKKLYIFILIALHIFVCCSPNTAKHEVTNIDNNRLSAQVDSVLANHAFNGVVLIAKDTIPLYKSALGYADLEEKSQLKLEHQFVIGSISKQITAVLVMREFEKGNLVLEDKLGEYLTHLKQDWKDEVSIHHLLAHTHGISDINQPLDFEPGTQFQYSQLGYDLLAQVLEKKTGKTFLDLSSNLFDEYGLRNTFHPKSKNYKRLVKGYEISERGDLVYSSSSLQNYAAAGSFISNAEDLAKWNVLLHTGKLVSVNTLDLMKTRYATRKHPVFEEVEYGYGLIYKKNHKESQIGALGFAPGFALANYYHPASKISLVVLCNALEDRDDFKKVFEVHTELMKLM
ncbi:serine hydrolase domain-containing protein [Aureibacter tunicatorum]|uniref:CubicO group peptidase (Beta-lactamase class C family) n=1 Tax=Aureibacter tunicatorum TaxID=866807 RepID=A0AAE4BU35_9BACT|nr:serine hydrolase domain-containing protein [Aureibacter tunicatorum]MDR6240610.1 CubicO group peptidase (beta-lactamase class C family) [Aureibacter tunicatorum]BDD06529.1 serine hydrolase [Aureibacter tunicatorum]